MEPTGGVFGATSICTMAVIAYDRCNVIVKGMAGTKMTSSKENKKNYSTVYIKTFEIIDHTLIIRTGSYPDRLLLDLRHWVVHHTILRCSVVTFRKEFWTPVLSITLLEMNR
jgi:hypothetical protein